MRKFAFIAPTVVGLVFMGCSSGEETERFAQATNNLWISGTPWPNKTVQVCWNDASQLRGDFATFADNSQGGAARSWTQATGLFFTDWGVCPANTNGVVVARMQSSGQSHCGPVSYNPNGPNDLLVSPGGATMMHEMGHCVGFAHEYNSSCTTGLNNGNLDTPLDRGSIMAGMGYCQSNQRISYWDEVGSQKVYGFRNFFADVTGDGKDDAVVVQGDQVMVRPANAASTGFGAGTDWTGHNYFYGDKGTFLADVSGDGKADLILVNDTRIIVRKSNGSSFLTPHAWTLGPQWGTLETHLADFTGDCRADAIFINDTETWVRPANNRATGFDGGSAVGPSRIATIERTVFANVSHAGAAKGCWADALYFDLNGVWVAKSNGSSLDAATNWSGGVPLRGSRATLVMDVTGDGLADIVAVFTDEIVVYQS